MIEAAAHAQPEIDNVLRRSRPCLASPAGVAPRAAIMLLCGRGPLPKSGLASPALAQPMPRRVGFADIVDKGKPAVISVRVNIIAGRRGASSQDSPLDRFFRRFGPPAGTP